MRTTHVRKLQAEQVAIKTATGEKVHANVQSAWQRRKCVGLLCWIVARFGMETIVVEAR